jgi:hypothetical protein
MTVTCRDSNALLDDFSLDISRIVDQLVKVVYITNNIFPHAGLQAFLLKNQLVYRVTTVSEPSQ